MLELDQSVLKWVSLSIATLLALMGAVAVCNEAHAFPFRRELLAFRRLPWYAKLVLIIFVCKFFAYGSVKTNQTDSVGGGATNDPPPLLTLSLPPRPAPRPTVTVLDIERGYQRMSEGWADHPTYTLMPTNAEHVGKWHLHGAYEDVVRVDFGDWLFPYGAQTFDHMWAFVWGKVRPNIHDAEREMAPVGAPMSAIPSVSRLWTASTPCDSRLITWERFTLGRVPIESLVTNFVDAQVELFPNGDYIIRSNEVEKVYRRIDPEDWDGDGWHNDDDLHPCDFDEAWSDLYQDLPSSANPDAYCWVDVRCDYNSYVSFVGDGYSDLCDPSFTALAGEVYRVSLLIGKTYFVDSTRPLTVVGRSDPSVEVTDDGTCWPIICWPVEFTVGDGPSFASPGLFGATWNDGGRAFHVQVSPSFLGGVFDWDEGGCCSVWGDGLNFAFRCDNACTCEGCSVYGYYGYEGYRLPVGGVSCGCSYVEDEGPAEVAEFGFTKAAVIYEDTYTNMPGEVVHPAPSNTVLRCVVRGGTYGGRLTVSLNAAGDSRIRRVGGNALPTDVEIAPGTERTFETEYTPVASSEREGDIVATLTYTENFLGTVHSDTARLTSVKVELEAYRQAKENKCQQRHYYGVGEDVRINYYPVSLYAECEAVINNEIADESTVYRVPNSFTCIYQLGEGRVELRALGCWYSDSIKVIEPEIEVKNVRANDKFPEEAKRDDPHLKDVEPVVGEAGHLLLFLDLYAKPHYVSFQGLQFVEIPDESGSCSHEGYYDNETYGGPLSHTAEAGAGRWHEANSQGFFATDAAGTRGSYHEPWKYGSKEWPIPMGWGYSPVVYGRFSENPTTQKFVLTADGTFRIEKFGHNAERNAEGLVWVDGHLQLSPWPW